MLRQAIKEAGVTIPYDKYSSACMAINTDVAIPMDEFFEPPYQLISLDIKPNERLSGFVGIQLVT